MDRNGRRSESLESDEELNGLNFEEYKRLKSPPRVENYEFKLEDKADEISLRYGEEKKSESSKKAKSESESEKEDLRSRKRKKGLSSKLRGRNSKYSDSESKSKSDDEFESDEEDDCRLKKKSRNRSKSKREMRRRRKSRHSSSDYDESEENESQGSNSNSEDRLRSKKKKNRKSPSRSKTKKESKTDRESFELGKALDSDLDAKHVTIVENEVIKDESNVQALKLKGIFEAQKKPALDNEPVVRAMPLPRTEGHINILTQFLIN
ncbi:unnamed protein product [Prunus armeniaca]